MCMGYRQANLKQRQFVLKVFTISQAYKYLGLNNYTEEELKQLSTISDMFGYDVDIDFHRRGGQPK